MKKEKRQLENQSKFEILKKLLEDHINIFFSYPPSKFKTHIAKIIIQAYPKLRGTGKEGYVSFLKKYIMFNAVLE